MKFLSPLRKASLCVGFILTILVSFGSVAVAQTCVQPPAGLVSWWPGDGNAQDITGPNDGILQAGTTFAPGMVGQAFSFDGIDDFVEVTDSPSVNIGTGDFSLDAWIQTNFPDLQSIMDKRVLTASEPLGYAFSTATLGLEFQLGNGDSFTNYPSGAFVQDGNFHHVAVTVRRGSPEGGRLFVDGAVVLVFDPTPYAGNLDNTADFRIGGHSLDYPAFSFHGLIDELTIYSRALSAEEIAAIFNAGSAGKCKGVPFTPLAAQATLSVGSQAADDTFDLRAAFILGDGSDGIDPVNEAVILRVGTSALTIPAGSFHRTSRGAFQFAGMIEGVTLDVTITPLTRATFEVVAHGEGATLSGVAVPVPVGFTIGDDSGSTTLPIAEVSARTPPPQR